MATWSKLFIHNMQNFSFFLRQSPGLGRESRGGEQLCKRVQHHMRRKSGINLTLRQKLWKLVLAIQTRLAVMLI